MGKRGSWFAAIKRIFVASSKEKPTNDTREKESKGKKKKGPGQLKNGERKSFKIPLFREPSSIEKILGDAEREHNILFRPPTPPEQPQTPLIVPSLVASTSNLSQRVASPRVVSPRATSPRASSPEVASPRAASPRVVSPRSASQRFASPRAASPRATSPRVASSRGTSSRSLNHQKEVIVRPEPSITFQHASATRIQAAFRGYMARRSFRALRGLVRLQGVIRGQNVRRQTTNASKYMHLSVRVQSQIRSWRIQRLENQARNQAQYKNDKEVESTCGKWSLASEAGNREYWDDTAHTKEEREARLQRKAEAAIKRERARAYAYSHQLSRANPRTAQTSLADIQSGVFPWWWNWIERQLPLSNPAENQSVKSFRLTPPRRNSELKPSPRILSINHKLQTFGSDNFDASTPRSSRSMMVMSSKRGRVTPTRTPRASSPSISQYSIPRAGEPVSPFGLPMRDDESLTSCPPFLVPNYMTPTVSARAKARASSNPKERRPGTPSSESSRRLSYPLTRGIGSTFAWNKGIGSQNASSNDHHDRQSVGNMSVDSTASSVVGRKPFNRFV
ncbi:protein IQ-DOMAIN 14 [Syzygium oleosum]|uniref:protein IQ-DOMAIN 14 n=1 Tax=Syzygium oleosum TaxID=219896 RepID=UPI0024B9DE66|nr:protein IQ-DOMAIN 14 [Syzygium oleosum]XP_056161404.1 protein IQ-DOMAIN 14 [Syzygium oleosum]XP_056161405.1 protein IQ-DOMAIN 14 [Syzygium oleosum]XP_056161406.1 protein IQ-DOMAIN 14 [Syzygium oleosum]